MAITSLQRSSGTQPSVVHMVADDSYKTVIGSTYIADQEENIKSVNRGEFTWNDGDQVLAELPSGNYNLTVNVALDQSVTLEEPPEREQVAIEEFGGPNPYQLDANSADMQIIDNYDTEVILPEDDTVAIGRQFHFIQTAGDRPTPIKTADDVEITQIGYSQIPLTVTRIPSGFGRISWSTSPLVSVNYFFEPEITFATAGDLSVSYQTQDGQLVRNGNLLRVDIRIRFTPTYTTASGALIITGLPVDAEFINDGYGGVLESNGFSTFVDPFSYPTNCTVVVPYITGDVNTVSLRGMGSGVSNTDCSTSEFVSGTNYIFKLSIMAKAKVNLED